MSEDVLIPKVGMFVTRYIGTDRRSDKIVSVHGPMLTTASGRVIYLMKNGRLKAKWSEIEFIKKGDNMLLHDRYVSLGGVYRDGMMQTVIEGLTAVKKRWCYLDDCRLTEIDRTYTDPSF